MPTQLVRCLDHLQAGDQRLARLQAIYVGGSRIPPDLFVRALEIVEAAGEATWRMMRLLMAGTAHVMSERSARATAYRVVLQQRASGRARARDRGEATLALGSRP